MSRYNTDNPIGSADPRDRDDNSKNLDEAVNTTEDRWTDRLGNERVSLAGAVDPSGFAQSALNDANRAEAAADAAFVNADVYDDVVAGIDGTDDGDQFQVVEGDEVVRYLNDDDAAVEVARYPAGDAVNQLATMRVPARAALNLNSYSDQLQGGQVRPLIADPDTFVGSNGANLRIPANSTICTRQAIALGNRTSRGSSRREVDLLEMFISLVASDSTIDVDLGCLWLDSEFSEISESVGKSLTLGVGQGVSERLTFARDLSYRADLKSPSGAAYAVPFVRITGDGNAPLFRFDFSDVTNFFTIRDAASLDKSGSVFSIIGENDSASVFDFHSPESHFSGAGGEPSIIPDLASDKDLVQDGGSASFRSYGGATLLMSDSPNTRYKMYPPLVDPESDGATLVLSHVQFSTEGQQAIFWQNISGGKGRMQFTGNRDNEFGTDYIDGRFRVFFEGAEGSVSGIPNNLYSGAHPSGIGSVFALVFRRGGKSELWQNGYLLDVFDADVRADVESYIFSHPSIQSTSLNQGYGRIFSIDRALSGSELEIAMDWARGDLVKSYRPPQSIPKMQAQGAVAIRFPTPYSRACAQDRSRCEVMFATGEDESILMASTAKIMTAILMMRHVDSWLSTIVVSESDVTGGAGAGTIEAGDIVSMRDALYLLMLESNNTIAQSIARVLGDQMLQKEGEEGDGFSRFIQEMNAEAGFLGMKNTNFTEPQGGNDAFSSAFDMAACVAAASDIPELMACMGADEITISIKGGNPRDVLINGPIEFIRATGGVDSPYRFIAGKGGTLVINPPPEDRTRNLCTVVDSSYGKLVFVTMKTPPSGDRVSDHLALLDAVVPFAGGK